MKNLTDKSIMKELLADDNTLSQLTLEELGIELFLVYQGNERLSYYMFLKGSLLFAGYSFRPAPVHGTYSLEASVSCLSFLAVQEGDVESKYFAKYTEDQLAWCRSFECEQLKGFIGDFDDKDSEFHEASKNMFKKGFKAL